MLILLENSILLWYKDNNLSNTSQSIYKYFILRTLVAKALESEIVYILISNSLLPLLIELQKGDALAAEKGKAGEKGKAAGVSGR